MLKKYDKCVKILKNGKPEKSYKSSPTPKVYVVKNVDSDGRVTIYNNDSVVFDSQGNCIISPPTMGIFSSNWGESKLVKIEDI